MKLVQMIAFRSSCTSIKKRLGIRLESVNGSAPTQTYPWGTMNSIELTNFFSGFISEITRETVIRSLYVQSSSDYNAGITAARVLLMKILCSRNKIDLNWTKISSEDLGSTKGKRTYLGQKLSTLYGKDTSKLEELLRVIVNRYSRDNYEKCVKRIGKELAQPVSTIVARYKRKFKIVQKKSKKAKTEVRYLAKNPTRPSRVPTVLGCEVDLVKYLWEDAWREESRIEEELRRALHSDAWITNHRLSVLEIELREAINCQWAAKTQFISKVNSRFNLFKTDKTEPTSIVLKRIREDLGNAKTYESLREQEISLFDPWQWIEPKLPPTLPATDGGRQMTVKWMRLSPELHRVDPRIPVLLEKYEIARQSFRKV